MMCRNNPRAFEPKERFECDALKSSQSVRSSKLKQLGHVFRFGNHFAGWVWSGAHRL